MKPCQEKEQPLFCVYKNMEEGVLVTFYVDSMWEGTPTSGYVYTRLSTEVAVIILGSSQIVTQQ